MTESANVAVAEPPTDPLPTDPLPTDGARSAPGSRSLVELLDAARHRGPDPVLADVDDEQLEQRVRDGAAQIAAATCRWLELVAEFVRRGNWAHQGFGTPGAWLAWAVSMGSSTAREHVRVALSLADWPQVRTAFRDGRISYSKVRAITRYGDPAAEGLLLRYARHADGAQMERILRSFDSAVPTDVDGATAHERRDVRFLERDADTAELRLMCPLEDVARIFHVLTERGWDLRDEARTAAKEAAEQDGVDPVPPEAVGAYRADALLAAVEAVAEALPEDASGSDRHTVVWHVPVGDDSHEADGGVPVGGRVPVQVSTSAGARGRSMSPRTLARLACGAAAAVARHDDDGELTSMSGRTRRVPPRLMRGLRARDRRCRYPGCGATRFVDAHHIQHVADGGATRMDNLVLLCVRHHHVVHDRDVTIRHDGRGRMRFVLPGGRTLEPSPALGSASAEARSPQAVDDFVVPPAVLQPTAYEARIDLAACVDALLAELNLLEPPRTLTEAA